MTSTVSTQRSARAGTFRMNGSIVSLSPCGVACSSFRMRMSFVILTSSCKWKCGTALAAVIVRTMARPYPLHISS